MKLGKVYPCLSIFEVVTKNSNFKTDDIKKIKKIVENLLGIECIVNYYIDKRERHIVRPINFYGQNIQMSNFKKKPSVIIGIFSPSLSLEGRTNRRKFIKLQKRYDIIDTISCCLKNKYFVNKIKIYNDRIVASLDATK